MKSDVVMKRNTHVKIWLALLLSCGLPALLCAQEPPDKAARRARQEDKRGQRGPAPPNVPAPGIGYVSSEFRFGGKVVKNAPYSAEAVTESTQVLANGTKLSQKTVALVYRDSEGRTRREQSAAPVGPFATSGETPRVIFISDPVAGVAYTLYPDTHTAVRTALPPAEIINAAGPKAALAPPPNQVQPVPRAGDHEQTVSLGKREIAGLRSDGERTTLLIPVNRIGNDQPIEIVEERWKSPELRTTLWSKTSDPRWGETLYQLTNIKRGEPDRALFLVPSDYIVKDSKPKREEGERRPPLIR